MTARAQRILAAVILAASAALTIVPTGVASASTAKIQITGTVSDRGGYPLAGMTVQVVRADHEDSDFASARTDWAGAFVSPKIPVDATMKYVLRVTDPTGRHLEKYSKEFAATAANRKQNVTLANAGIIRGKVTTNDGDVVRPARFVLVTANNSVSVGTSSQGTFSLGGLPSGTYTLLFEDYDEDGTRPGPLFSSICYDNIPRPVGNCADSTKVTVTAGKVTTIHPQVLDHRLGSQGA